MRDQLLQELYRTAHARLVRLDAGADVLQHGERMQRDVWAAPGVGRRRQVVGIGFAVDLEHGDGQRNRHGRALGEPLGVGPGLDDAPRVGVAGVGQPLHVVEGVEHQKRVLQGVGGDSADLGVSQKIDERLDVEAAEHRAQEFRGAHARDQRDCLFALGDPGEELGLDLGRVVDAGRHAVDHEIEKELGLAGRRRA